MAAAVNIGWSVCVAAAAVVVNIGCGCVAAAVDVVDIAWSAWALIAVQAEAQQVCGGVCVCVLSVVCACVSECVC